MNNRNKRGAVSTTMSLSIGLIILVLLLIIYFAIVKGTISLSKNPDVAICSQSAIQSGLLRSPIKDQEILSFYCPVSLTTITNSQMSATVSSKKLVESGYRNKETYNVDKAMFNQVQQCLQKVNYGVLPLFQRELFSLDNPTYCVVCSVVSFEDGIAEKVAAGTPTYFVSIQNISELKTTTEKFFSERNDVFGSIESTYHTNEKQAVIYYRSQASLVSTIEANLGLGELGKGILTVAEKIRRLPKDSLTNVDVDGIIILSQKEYEDRTRMKEICSVIGNEKYVNTVN